MTGLAAFLVAATTLTVAPTDRLAMADRLFNRGEYAAAQAEYRSLVATNGVDAAELAYRHVAVANALGDKAQTRRMAEAFLAKFPTQARADRVRLVKALAGTPTERVSELRLLDRDGVSADLRGEALYRLGEATGDVSYYERSFRCDPKGRYAGYAKVAHAAKILESPDMAERRRGLSELMDIVYGKDEKLARDALYLAAVTSYREARHGECSALLKRYQKLYPGDVREKDVRRLAVLAALGGGRYADALALATDKTDDAQAYALAIASDRLGDKATAQKAAQAYLDDFPQGSCRPQMELLLSHLAFETAVKADDKTAILAAAKRSAELSKTAADRLRLGWAEEKAGEISKAEATYEAVARDFPKTEFAADALYRRAMSLLRRENWSAGELALAEACGTGKLEKSRAASAAYWRGVSALRLGHAAEGVRFLREALAGGLELDLAREARLHLADEDLKSGHREEAVKAYSELVAEGAAARMSAAKILQVGQLVSGDPARICARQLVANESSEWRQAGYRLLGDTEEAAGNFAAAADAYEKCLAQTCTTASAAPASVKLGEYQLKEGDLAAAEKTLKRAVELNRTDGEARARAYLLLAKVSQARGDAEAAKGYATVVVTLFEKTKVAAEAREILR